MNEFDLCQFGFVDVDLLRLLLTAQRIGSQTTTCRNKKANCNTRTSTGTGSKTFFFFFKVSIWFVQHPRVYLRGSVYVSMLSGQWEERKDNTKSDTIPRSCWKTTLKTIVIKHLTDFGLEFAHTPACSWDQEAFIMSSAWGKNKKSNLWNIHLLTRAQGDCGRTLTHTHTHTGDLQARWSLKVWLRCLSKSVDAQREESRLRTSFFGWTRRDWLDVVLCLGVTCVYNESKLLLSGAWLNFRMCKIRVLDIRRSFGIVKVFVHPKVKIQSLGNSGFRRLGLRWTAIWSYFVFFFHGCYITLL